MDAKSYKCPSCGAALSFDEKSQKMKCKSCKNEYDPDDIDALMRSKEKSCDNFSWNKYDKNSGSGDWSSQEQEKIEVSTCPSCGAEIIADKNTAATSCIYCGNPTIIENRLSGLLRPDYVIPFKIDKETAQKKLSEFCKKKMFLPKKFIKEHAIEKMTGMYVPFWLFGCDTSSEINYNAIKKSFWSDSKYDYEKTDYYLIIREGDMTFQNVPVDASEKIDDDFMESIEPFHCNEAVDFKTAFLSGFLADKYDKTSEESHERANERIRNSIIEEFKDTVCGYQVVNATKTHIDMSNGDIKYALFPIWFFNAKYNDKSYRFAVNGQTGKIIGELPFSKLRFALWWLLFWIGMSALALLVFFYGGL